MLTIWLQLDTIATSALSVDFAAQTSITMATTSRANSGLTIITTTIWKQRIECFMLTIWLQLDTMAFPALSAGTAAQTAPTIATTPSAASGLTISAITVYHGFHEEPGDQRSADTQASWSQPSTHKKYSTGKQSHHINGNRSL